jgi:hypothetical protein
MVEASFPFFPTLQLSPNSLSQSLVFSTAYSGTKSNLEVLKKLILIFSDILSLCFCIPLASAANGG